MSFSRRGFLNCDQAFAGIDRIGAPAQQQTGTLNPNSCRGYPTAACCLRMSFSSVCEAANNTSDASTASTGIRYMALCRPIALYASVMAAAPAVWIAARAKGSVTLRGTGGPQ